jgi:predicted PurR-regulated permease PerM
MTEGKILRALLGFSLLAAFAWFLFAIRSVLLPFLLAAILAYALSPAVTFMELRGIRRSTAAVLLYAVLLATAAFLAYWAIAVLWHDLPRLRYEFPVYLEKFRVGAVQAEQILGEQWPAVREQRYFQTGFENLLLRFQRGMQEAPSYLSSVLDVAFYALLVPFVCFFLLGSGRRTFQRILDRCPGRWVEKFLSLLFEIDEVLGNYLRGILLEAFLVGVLSFAGLAALGVDQAPLIAAAAGLGNLIPYLGPFLGGTLGVIMAFLQFQDFAVPLQVVALFAAIQFIDGWVLEPIILKRAVDLHPVFVFFALLAGGHLGGFWGLLLAVPVACVLKELFNIFSVWYLSESGARSSDRELWNAAAKPWIV